MKKECYIILSVDESIIIKFSDHSREYNVSDMADGACGVCLCFNDYESALKYANGRGVDIKKVLLK